MRYIGGKSKLAKEISGVILENTTGRENYYEPFVGGGAVLAKLGPNFENIHIGDFHPDLVEMWKAVLLNGWNPPENITEDEYRELRIAETSALRGFVGFGGSFGGKWFGGFARGRTNKGEPRNYVAESARAISRIRDELAGKTPTIYCQSYSDWSPGPGSVIYCDPPYADTQGYSTGGFDSEAFWAKMDEWSEHSSVFVSEYTAPPIGKASGPRLIEDH